ncbi:hypothetical protein [Kineosporia babensis]|uniref:Uncharacterized protein n=1 Tax=Kineosporia babensis TaxID=499548 RepID=A0A9X1SSX3_9ACTN|nr:hypothetical protein [Kineosporia babensis]MCD5311034.1 hypothetical protein [Kineosporia babensis]
MEANDIATAALALIAVVVSAVAARQARAAARLQANQQFKFDGAMSAIAWREQVLDLHDRGLSPHQIRRIMLLEDGGEGYEEGNGRIEDVLREVPRSPKRD